MKNQGAECSSESKSGPNLHETPCAATFTLIRETYGTLPNIIWEPFAGRGAISRVLELHGHDVIKHDLYAWDNADEGIQTPYNFFDFKEAPGGADIIVTNPPFSVSDRVIRHALGLVDLVVVLHRLMYMEGDRKSDIIDGHLDFVLMGRERLPMMHREGYEGNKQNKSAAPFAWFFFTREKKTKKTFEVRRVSWYG